jgi:hypothetical protein
VLAAPGPQLPVAPPPEPPFIAGTGVYPGVPQTVEFAGLPAPPPADDIVEKLETEPGLIGPSLLSLPPPAPTTIG